MHQSGDEQPRPPKATTASTASESGPTRRRFPILRGLLRSFGLRRFGLSAPAPAQANMLPVLIKVFAGFTKVDGSVEEAEIDSSLSALRHEFPEAVYSELRRLYREAIESTVDLNEIAKELASQLAADDKLLLGAQLYALISQSGNLKEHLIPFYLFMTNLGVASEAIDLVYQLNTGEIQGGEKEEGDPSAQLLESMHVGRTRPADLVLPTLPEGYEMMAFRFDRLVLLKNIGRRPFVARGRHVPPGGFTQIYDGQRVLLGETMLSYADLISYFNAKSHLATTRVYLSFRWDGNAFVEKAVSKDTHLEIEFGLGVKVRALRATAASVAGRTLSENTVVDVALTDRILLENGTEISLADLRRRARELGGRFELLPSKFLYVASTDPRRLDPGDILLSSQSGGGEVTLNIRCDFDSKTGELEVVSSDLPIQLGEAVVRGKASLSDGDTIRIGESQYLSCDFGERIIEEQRNLISDLEVVDLRHSYDGRETALDSVSITARRGEMIGIIGPSGCGKSTLIRALAGHQQPDGGRVLINGHSLYENLESLQHYISYIPQEDAFDPLLTVEENIDCAAAIRCPHLSPAERRKRADSRLSDLGLSERRHRLAGDAQKKILSGGERKRLNAGLDMISIAEIYLFDEPTSGLSSKDSEHVMEIIRGLSQNKITFVSIHQPSSRLFHMFQKVLLLDRGGRVAFYGPPADMLAYFREARAEEVPSSGELDAALEQVPQPALQPDFIFDVLETPLRDLSGNIVYEEDPRGHFIPARRFLPDYWADRFQAHRLLKEVRESKLETQGSEEHVDKRPLPTSPKRGVEQIALHLATHIKRAFLSKLRNRANLYTTLLEAPALALLIATVLRYSEDGDYTFASAFHIPTYLFLSLVVALFLGLTNSADEVIRDRGMLARERGHGIRVWHYITGKFLSLAVFALIQSVIYVAVGNAVLGIHDMFFHYLVWMFLTALSGAAIGLFISSVVKDSKTALNIIPLVLIPQIILGGALIKYEEMNRNLDFVYRIRKWLAKDETGQPEKPSELKVPVICEVMPLRWSYEAMVIAQDRHNPLARSQDELEAEIRTLAQIEDLDETQLSRLNAAKDALALVSGLEADTRRGVRQRLSSIRRDLKNDAFDIVDYPPPKSEEPVSSIDLYQNQKIRDLVAKAEMETEDYRLYEEDENRARPNVFFGLKKNYFGKEVPTLRANLMAMFGFIAAGLIALAISLRWHMKRV